MGQRTKAMDIESPTSKFLYAIIKQVDLKIVDWNAVARDLGISNGHAARMRYSRFKGQIDPSTAQRNSKRKASKKGEKGGPRGDMSMQMQPVMSMPLPLQIHCQMINSELVPKAEPMDSHCQSNPFVKCEPDHHVPEEGNFTAGRDGQHHPPDSMSSGSMAPSPRMFQYVPNGLPYSMTSSLPGSMPLSSSTPFGPYPMIPMPQDICTDEFGVHSHFLNPASMIAWEPTSAPPHEHTPFVPRTESTLRSVNNVPMIAWEPTSALPREHSPVAPRRGSTPVSVKEEPENIQNNTDTAVPIKVEETGQKE